MSALHYSRGQIWYSQKCINIYRYEDRIDYNATDLNRFWGLKSFSENVSVPVVNTSDYGNQLKSIIGCQGDTRCNRLTSDFWQNSDFEPCYLFESGYSETEALVLIAPRMYQPKQLINISRFSPAHIDTDYVEYPGPELTSDVELGAHAILSKILRTSDSHSIAPTDLKTPRSRIQVRNLYEDTVDEIIDIRPDGLHLLYSYQHIPYNVPLTKDTLLKYLNINPTYYIDHGKLQAVAHNIVEGRIFSSFGLDAESVKNKFWPPSDTELRMLAWKGIVAHYAVITDRTGPLRYTDYSHLTAIEAAHVLRYIKLYTKQKNANQAHNPIPVTADSST